MTTARQDAWNQDEDLLLAEVVLRHIRDGSTQLAAFKEVGEKLSRTAAACGFRWNSSVRKQYDSAIELAKQQRKSKTKEKKTSKTVELSPKTEVEGGELTFEEVLNYLKELRASEERAVTKSEDAQTELKKLAMENETLKKTVESVQEKCETLESDYKALMEVMDRARKMMNKK
jgi:prespore-specific regulator